MRVLSKRETVLLALTSLAMGVYGGQLLSNKLTYRLENRSKAVDISMRAAHTVKALYLLRSGDTNVTASFLEFMLMDDLHRLSWYSENLPELKWNPIYIEELKTAKEYRMKFPPKSESDLDQETVAGAFAVLEGQSGH